MFQHLKHEAINRQHAKIIAYNTIHVFTFFSLLRSSTTQSINEVKCYRLWRAMTKRIVRCELMSFSMFYMVFYCVFVYCVTVKSNFHSI